MPKPLEICIEELDRDEDEAFVRCVALPGGTPGLALDREGAVLWMPEGEGTYGLWVSADDRLVLLRASGAASISVARGDRTLEAPVGKPVILLDQDLLLLEGRRLRVHVHGETEAVYPPERLGPSAFGRLARAAAAAASLAIGSAAALGSGSGPAGASPAVGVPAPIEVRVRPPKPAPPRKQLDCTITKQTTSRKGPLVLEATCPSARGIYVGLGGHLLDPKTGQTLAKGLVKVTAVNGAKVVVEASQHTKRVPAKTIRFWVHSW